MQVTTLYNQVLIDIAMQVCGDVEQLFAVALLNSKSITADIAAGSVITANAAALDKTRYADLFVQKADRPASNDRIVNAAGGIGLMQIGTTFKVS